MSRPRPFWTEADDAILKANFPKLGDKDLAKLLGRTESAVTQRRHNLGMRHDQSSDAIQQARSIQLAARRGWAKVAICPREQDRNFQRALAADMKARGMTT